MVCKRFGIQTDYMKNGSSQMSFKQIQVLRRILLCRGIVKVMLFEQWKKQMGSSVWMQTTRACVGRGGGGGGGIIKPCLPWHRTKFPFSNSSNINAFFFGIFREASDRALKGSLLELVEDIFCAAEKEARRTGNDASMPRGLVSPAYPEMTFDAAEFQRFSKREEGLPNKIKELLRIPEDDRTLDQIQNVSITTNY